MAETEVTLIKLSGEEVIRDSKPEEEENLAQLGGNSPTLSAKTTARNQKKQRGIVFQEGLGKHGGKKKRGGKGPTGEGRRVVGKKNAWLWDRGQFSRKCQDPIKRGPHHSTPGNIQIIDGEWG